MDQGWAVFSQLIGFSPDWEPRRSVERHRGEVRLRGLHCNIHPGSPY
jgi:hypothetical protein